MYVLEVLSKQKFLKDKDSPYLQHGFIKSGENVIYNISTLKMALVLFILYFVLRCYAEQSTCMADEMPVF